MTTSTDSAPHQWLVILAFATLYIVWGSTYLAIKFAIETMPPLVMAGFRFSTAGTILYVLVGGWTYPRPTARQWRNAIFVGFAMFGIANGLVCWAQQVVPSGLTSLVIATTPIWMVALESCVFRRSKLTVRVAMGLTLGMMGAIILLAPSANVSSGIAPAGGLALMLACLSWSFGSMRSRTLDLPKSPFLTAAMQMLGGGALLLVISAVMGEWSQIDWQAISTKSVLAFAYLIVFGSIAALSAFTWLIRVCSISSVSTYAYVNPIVAVMLGTWLGREPLTLRPVVAAALIIPAVILIVGRRRGI